jgi:hypothetical protein
MPLLALAVLVEQELHQAFLEVLLPMLVEAVALEIVEDRQMALVVLVAVALLVHHLLEQTELPILAVVVAQVDLVLIFLVLAVQALSLSLTQAHNNSVVAQFQQVVVRLFTHSLLVVC